MTDIPECKGKCGAKLKRTVVCRDPRTSEPVADEEYFCGPGSLAEGKEKPPSQFQCAPCDNWSKQESATCQYRSDHKSCRTNEGVRPFTWICPSGNCGPKPADPTEAEFSACTVDCLAWQEKDPNAPCLNDDPKYASIKCSMGPTYRNVEYICPYDNGNPDVCGDVPESGKKLCTLPQCLEWKSESLYPENRECRVPSNPANFWQLCGDGLEYYQVKCEQPNMCNPERKPQETRPCRRNTNCNWAATNWVVDNEIFNDDEVPLQRSQLPQQQTKKLSTMSKQQRTTTKSQPITNSALKNVPPSTSSRMKYASNSYLPKQITFRK